MFRAGIVGCALLVAVGSGAKAADKAESPAERGAYLVNAIMACGNCHTPRDAGGKPIADKALVGRARLQYAGLHRHRTEHHARQGNRNWRLERRRDQARAGRGHAPGSRPPRRRAAGRDHAGQFLQGAAARRPRRHRRLFAQRRRRSATKSPIPSTRSRCAAIPIPTPTPDSARPMLADPVRRGAYLVTIGHCMECHSAWSRGVSDFKAGLGARRPELSGARGIAGGHAGSHRPQHHVASDRGHRRLDRRRNRTRHHPRGGRDGRPLKPPMAYGYYAALKDADLADIVAYLRTVPSRP